MIQGLDIREIVMEFLLPFLLPPFRSLLSPPVFFHNLSGERPQLVGREQERRWLRRWLGKSSEQSPIAVITGIGGVGKTALARDLAFEVLRWGCSRWRKLIARIPGMPQKPYAAFNALIWISGESISSVDRIAEKIAWTLQDKDLLSKPSNQLQDGVQEALGRQRALLILDSYEMMNPGVLRFVQSLPVPTRVLITSRRSVNNFPTLSLEMLELEEAVQLVQQEANRQGLQLSPEQMKELAQAARGLPLAIILSVARRKRGRAWEQVINQLREARGDLADRVVSQQIQEIQTHPAAWLVFQALALFDPEAGAVREALGFVAGLDEGARDDGLEVLRGWELLTHLTEDDRFRARHPLIYQAARDALAGNPNRADFEQRQVDWYRKLLLQRPQPVALLRRERPTLEAVLERLRLAEDVDRLALLLREASVLKNEGAWERYVDLARAVFRLCLEREDGRPLVALAWETLSRTGRRWREEFEKNWWPQLRKLLQRAGKEGEAEIRRVEIYLEVRKEQDPQKMVSGVEDFKAFFDRESEPPINEPELLIDLINHMGVVFSDPRKPFRDYQQAQQHLEEGRGLVKQYWACLREPEDWEAVLKGNLAILMARAEGRYREAMRILNEIRPKLSWKRDLAEWHLVMAVYAFRSGRIGKAWRYGQAGEKLLRESGYEHLDVPETEEWTQIRSRLDSPIKRLQERLRFLAVVLLRKA